MRALALLALLAMPVRPQSPPVQFLEGTVLNSVTGAPVEGARITASAANDSKAVGGPVVTGADGRFRLAVFPGMQVSLSKAGFGGFLHGTPPQTGHWIIRVDPWIQIAGRVLDPDRNPVPKARLRLQGNWGDIRMETAADGSFDNGVYPLKGGRYTITVVPPKDRPDLAVTYYPAPSHPDPIFLRPGSDLVGIDIRMLPGEHSTVDGVVVDEAGRPVAGAAVRLAHNSRTWEPEMETVTNAAGRFTLRNVPECEHWVLLATTGVPDKPSGRGYLPLATPRKIDPDRPVQLRLSAPITITGTAVLDASHAKRTGVYLIPIDAPSELQTMSMSDDELRFTLEGVTPGRYRIHPAGYLPGYYVERVLLGDRDVLGQPVDVGPGMPPFEVIYRGDAGRVQGRIEKGAGATVVLVPRDPALRNGQFIRTGPCSDTGEFQVHSLRPGDYYAFAFQWFDQERFSEPAFVETLAGAAVNVTVEKGSTQAITLKLADWPSY